MAFFTKNTNEKMFISESTIFLKDRDASLSEQADLKKTANLMAELKDGIAGFYKQSDKELIENSSSLFSFVKKWLFLTGVFMINPVLGLIAWYTNRCLKLKYTKEQKERLLFKLKTQVDILDEKIKDEQDRDKKYKMMKLKAEYERSIEKLRDAPIIEDV